MAMVFQTIFWPTSCESLRGRQDATQDNLQRSHEFFTDTVLQKMQRRARNDCNTVEGEPGWALRFLETTPARAFLTSSCEKAGRNPWQTPFRKIMGSVSSLYNSYALLPGAVTVRRHFLPCLCHRGESPCRWVGLEMFRVRQRCL